MCYLSSDRLFQLMHYYKYVFRHGNFISKIKNTGGFQFILWAPWNDWTHFGKRTTCLIKWEMVPLQQIVYFCQMHFLVSPFGFIVMRKEGKKNCSLGTFCSQKCGTWKGKCQPFFMVVCPGLQIVVWYLIWTLDWTIQWVVMVHFTAHLLLTAPRCLLSTL